MWQVHKELRELPMPVALFKKNNNLFFYIQKAEDLEVTLELQKLQIRDLQLPERHLKKKLFSKPAVYSTFRAACCTKPLTLLLTLTDSPHVSAHIPLSFGCSRVVKPVGKGNCEL